MKRSVSGLLLLLALSCGRPESDSASRGPLLANHDRSVAYVGAQACAKCHQEIAATHARTGMGRSAYRMTPAVAVEDFTTSNLFVDESTGLHYRMFERDDAYWMRQFLVDSKGTETYADERRIDWVIGSNHHSRSYVTIRDGAWYQMPVCWYPEPAIWDTCPGFENANVGFRREVSSSCVFCHNGRMVLKAGETKRYEDPVPEGIGCERCHGPGALHVEKWSDGEMAPTGASDPTIHNPARVPPPRRSEICYQCHLGDSKATERANRWDRSREDYRPGRPITEAFVAMTYREPSVHAFGLSAQADRLFLSRCFRETKGQLDCLTCHNPHVTVYRKDRPADFFNAKCAGCHAKDACAAPESARAATDPPDDCVQCHMRKAEAHDQEHASFTDHWIRRDLATDPAERRVSLDVVPAIPDPFRALEPGERLYAAGRGLFGLATDWPPGPERAALVAAAETSLREAGRKGFEHPERDLLLAKTLADQGRLDEAAAAHASVLRADPANAEAALKRGRALLAAGRAEEAVAQFRTGLERHPDDSALLEELAVIELGSNRPDAALAACDRALARDPIRPRAHANRGIALWKLRRYPEAIDAMRTAAALDPMDVEVWRFLAGSLREAGFREEAEEAAARVRFLRARVASRSVSSEMGDE
jgi:Flp pilus assembly protein TadD